MNRRICVFLGLVCVFGVAGCGGSAGATKPIKLQKTAVRVTSTSAPEVTATTTPAQPTDTATLPTATSGAIPQVTATHPPPTAAPAAQSARLIYAQLRPDVVQPGATLQGSVQTSGGVTRVQMYLGSGIPSAVPPAAIELRPDSPGTWTGMITAPSAPGEYHFTVGIFDAAGNRRVIDNDGWNVTVAGAAPTAVPPTVSTGVQSLPANIPLAPAFQWSNPTAATFSAEGRSIAGSEVASNSRPDVPASAVTDFYTTRLPRSGWAIDSSTLPAPGASAFTIVATSGSQVCVVQYGGAAIQIFYGSM